LGRKHKTAYLWQIGVGYPILLRHTTMFEAGSANDYCVERNTIYSKMSYNVEFDIRAIKNKSNGGLYIGLNFLVHNFRYQSKFYRGDQSDPILQKISSGENGNGGSGNFIIKYLW
jgi:hypothetical protein